MRYAPRSAARSSTGITPPTTRPAGSGTVSSTATPPSSPAVSTWPTSSRPCGWHGDFRPVTSIRGGGHQVAGSAVCDDGLVIDLSAMRAVHVDATARTARVQAGATWGDVDRATQVHGLATPGGEVSVTGVAGLTLGGGLGVMMRTHGLSCDNLRSVEIVTADGMVRTASRDEHADLSGPTRRRPRAGRGHVAGIRPPPPRSRRGTGLVLYPYQDAATVLRAWRDAVRRAPDQSTRRSACGASRRCPTSPTDSTSAGRHGRRRPIGPPAEAGPVLAPLQSSARRSPT